MTAHALAPVEPVRAGPARAALPADESHIHERQRSVDGLNSWQMEQVRQIVREELAALPPLAHRLDGRVGPLPDALDRAALMGLIVEETRRMSSGHAARPRNEIA